MGPDGAVIMPEIAAGAVRGPDVGGTASPNRACGAVVVQGRARPRAAHPMVRKLLSRAEPDVARRVHPGSGGRGGRKGVGCTIPGEPIPAQDRRVARDPHVGGVAPPDIRESVGRGNGNDRPGPRMIDAPDHGTATARSEPDWEECKERPQTAYANRIHPF